MNDDDRLRLTHIQQYGQEIAEFARNATRDELETNKVLVRALSYNIGIIGEAAGHISDTLKQANPIVPWRDIVGMRTFLFHEYFRIDLDLLWETAMRDVPALLIQTTSILETETPKD
jgi:uncharacterized protein with HEPN domain